MDNEVITQFTNTNTDLYFLRFNLLNDYYMSVAQSTTLYTNDLYNTADENSILLIFLVVSSVFSFLALVCITPIFNLVNRN